MWRGANIGGGEVSHHRHQHPWPSHRPTSDPARCQRSAHRCTRSIHQGRRGAVPIRSVRRAPAKRSAAAAPVPLIAFRGRPPPAVYFSRVRARRLARTLVAFSVCSRALPHRDLNQCPKPKRPCAPGCRPAAGRPHHNSASPALRPPTSTPPARPPTRGRRLPGGTPPLRAKMRLRRGRHPAGVSRPSMAASQEPSGSRHLPLFSVRGPAAPIY